MGNLSLYTSHHKHDSNGSMGSIQYYMCSMQGWRDTLEDAYLIQENEDNEVFGLFDGHGGAEVATFAAMYFMEFLSVSSKQNREINETTIKLAFTQLDSVISKKCNSQYQGSTALVAIITQEIVHIANLGDCRAMIFDNDKYTVLTEDHTAVNESQRIYQCGGYIKDERVNGSLLVSRALGDFHLKQTPIPIVSNEPDVLKITRPKCGEYLLLASDGLWECANNTEIHEFINQNIQFRDVLHRLFDKFVAKTNDGELGCDNMTAILIKF